MRGTRARSGKKTWGPAVAFALLVLLAVGIVAARIGVRFIPPHVAFPASAVLSDDKKKQLVDALDEAVPTDRDQAIDFALELTARSLSFSLGHATSFEFSAGSRRGNGSEYAALFVAVFEVAAKRAGSSARAYRVRSDARVFGKKIPLAAFASHDWILVADAADGARIYLDPTFSDLWLTANIGRNVQAGDAIKLAK